LNSKNNKYLNGTIIITLLTALLYLIGNSFHRGYLEAFNIKDELFPASFQESLLIGLHALKSLGFALLGEGLLLIFILFLLFGPIAFKLSEKTGAKIIRNWMLRLIGNILIILLLFFDIWCVSQSTESIATKEGHTDMRLVPTDRMKIVNITYDGLDNKCKSINGYMFEYASSQSYIAVYSNYQVTIIPVGHIRKIDILN